MLLQLLVCVLLLTPVTQCQQLDNHPEWLWGLQQLLQQHGGEQQQPVTAARLQSSAHHSHDHPAGQLLRPRALPAAAAAAARVAALQQEPDSSQGVTLASVGRLYGVPQGHLQHMMQQDPGLLVSKQGLLVWSCSGGGSHTHHSHDSLEVTAESPNDCTTTSSLEPTCQEGSGTDMEQAAVTQATMLAALEAATVPDATPWLTHGLFTAVIPPPAAAHSDGAGMQPPPAQPDPWTPPVLATAAASSTATLQSTPAAAASQELPFDKTLSVVVQQPGPTPAPQHAFKLHSQPPGSVQHTIFLDFRGCSISNSFWNTATSKSLLTTQPYDLDGDPSSFSVQEQQAIVTIHQAVSQDFAPWGVDVTTEDPGTDALVRSDAEDARFGMHVCVGGSSASTVGGMSGGLAFTGAWGQLGSGLQPVLVFPEQLGKGHARAVADSISHEVGHTFGLAHFGGSGSAPYNDGAGPWGPLLGLPYGRVLSQWSVGTAVTGALQDDLQLIAQQLPVLADDHGDGPETATPLCKHGQVTRSKQGPGRAASAGHVSSLPAGSLTCQQVRQKAVEGSDPALGPQEQEVYMVKATVRGVISNSSDSDWFRVHAGAPGKVQVKLQLPSSADSKYGVNNLLAAVRITGSDGVQLAAAEPVAGSEVVLQATADVAVAGDVFVSVVPAGVPGVSSYGSLGSYLLSVTFPSQMALAAPAEQRQARSTAGSTRRFSVPAALPAGPGINARETLCDARRGFTVKSSSDSQPAGVSSSSSSTCGYQHVRPLSFSTTACSTAVTSAVVLLKFSVSDPPACFEGSVVAAAPRLEPLLQNCPCRRTAQQTHKLPVPASAVPADGSFTCRQGVYSYGWQVPDTPGCYRLSIEMADGSSVVTVTVLRVVDGRGGDGEVVTQLA